MAGPSLRPKDEEYTYRTDNIRSIQLVPISFSDLIVIYRHGPDLVYFLVYLHLFLKQSIYVFQQAASSFIAK